MLAVYQMFVYSVLLLSTPASCPCIECCLCLCLSEFSPLQSLIINGDVEALKDLVRRGSSCLTEPNDDGWIALHEAAYYGQLQCVIVLVTGEELVSGRLIKETV